MSALYLLAEEYAESHAVPKPLKDFEAYADGRIETSTARVLSAFERLDKEAFQFEMEKCKALNELQKTLVQQMRDNMVGR